MTTAGAIPPLEPELGVRANHGSPVVVAAGGRCHSEGALRAGRCFAGGIDALRVVDVESIDGDPARALASLAHEAGATMIVTGIGQHSAADRILGDETALSLIHLADAPTFAASETFAGAPERIVVAVDFTETSLRAARMSLELAAPGASIYLAHVVTRDRSMQQWKEWSADRRQTAADGLADSRAELRVPDDMLVENVVLEGDVASEVLAFARRVGADLIATGGHGRGFVARMLAGSVATRIIRSAQCSVLCVPPAATALYVGTTLTKNQGRSHSPWV